MLPIVGAILVACGGNSHTTDAAPVTVPTISVAPVTPVNHAPTFASANTSSSVTLMSQPAIISLPYAKDVDSGDTLVYTVSNLPTGVTYDPSTHSISISPTTTPNTYTLNLVATDKSRASATMVVSLEVLFVPPVLPATLPDISVGDNGG